jgi:hypothetical protein
MNRMLVGVVVRRAVLKALAGLVLAIPPTGRMRAVHAEDGTLPLGAGTEEALKMRRALPARSFIERRVNVVRIGINRPKVYNRTFANLEPQCRALYATEDFKEGRRAEAEGRTPNHQGK